MKKNRINPTIKKLAQKTNCYLSNLKNEFTFLKWNKCHSCFKKYQSRFLYIVDSIGNFLCKNCTIVYLEERLQENQLILSLIWGNEILISEFEKSTSEERYNAFRLLRNNYPGINSKLLTPESLIMVSNYNNRRL